MTAQYASDLVEMTNNFASKHIDHIAVLTKQLHECQIGSELTPMITVLQHTVSLQVSQTKGTEESPLSGFEEVLKSLPIREVKSFVDGIQRLMERAKSLQDLILMTERENERKRADARIEAERQASEERIRELMEENARLKAMVEEQGITTAGAAASTMQGELAKRFLANKGKARDQYRNVQLSASVLKESSPKSPGAEKTTAHGDRASQLGGDAPEESIRSLGSSEEEVGYTRKGKARKRREPPTDRSLLQATRRSKRQMSHYDGPTGMFDDLAEDSDFMFLGEAERIGSRTHLDKSTGDGMDTHDDLLPNTWAQHAAESYKFGASHLAVPAAPSGGIYGGELPDQMGHPSTELALEYANRSQSGGETTAHAELGVVRRKGRISTAKRGRKTGGVQADGGFAGNTEQEPKPEKSAQQPAGPMKTTQESKLVQNMEQVQGMVEKLSLLLQVGQHAIGEHEAGVTLTAQS